MNSRVVELDRASVEDVLDKMEAGVRTAAETIVVAVRSRPLNSREQAAGASVRVKFHGGVQVEAYDPGRGTAKRFTFDHALWSTDDSSADPEDAPFATQETVFGALGVRLLCNAWHGYNATIFAYGQTGSGKSYSISGLEPDDVPQWGLVPRICYHLFEMVKRVETPPPLPLPPPPQDAESESAAMTTAQCVVEASFLEIYNEKVRDLLAPDGKAAPGGLSVHELPKHGVFVKGLRKALVHSFAEVQVLMDRGNAKRTVASTKMNATSSRSHSVFTIYLQVTTTTTTTMPAGGDDTVIKKERQSKLNLCDLAGSERADRTGATGALLKEGAGINKSLSALGRCITSLADKAKACKKSAGGADVVPFRESQLTHLLKDSLGGNARTLMLCAISPASDSAAETISTLRYADAAKSIKTKAVKNETPAEKLINALSDEVARLKAALQQVKVKEEEGAGGEGGNMKLTANKMLAASAFLTAGASSVGAERKALEHELGAVVALHGETSMSVGEKRALTEELVLKRCAAAVAHATVAAEEQHAAAVAKQRIASAWQRSGAVAAAMSEAKAVHQKDLVVQRATSAWQRGGAVAAKRASQAGEQRLQGELGAALAQNAKMVEMLAHKDALFADLYKQMEEDEASLAAQEAKLAQQGEELAAAQQCAVELACEAEMNNALAESMTEQLAARMTQQGEALAAAQQRVVELGASTYRLAAGAKDVELLRPGRLENLTKTWSTELHEAHARLALQDVELQAAGNKLVEMGKELAAARAVAAQTENRAGRKVGAPSSGSRARAAFHAEAEQLYRRALALQPDHVDTLHNLASLLDEDLGGRTEAEQLYRRALALQPDDVDDVDDEEKS